MLARRRTRVLFCENSLVDRAGVRPDDPIESAEQVPVARSARFSTFTDGE